MLTLSYYPGCSMKTSSKFYETSMKKVFAAYGVNLKELDDWSCCGASAASTIDEATAYALPAMNIAAAEKEGLNLFAPCSACYNRSLVTNDKIRKDPAVREEINRLIAPSVCRGTVKVLNIIEVLLGNVGLERIAGSIAYDLSNIKVVPYYGCVLTRIPGVKVFDNIENPTSMDDLIWTLGSKQAQWPYKTECCGASKTLTDRSLTARLSGKIMDKAVSVDADAIVTPCPLCQMNLDLLPYIGTNEKNLPVLFLPELFELALFGNIEDKSGHMIPVDSLSGKVKKK